MRYKVAVRFAVEGDLRYISHHDMVRLFERALARTQLPVRFTEGFNPRPKLSLPLPRPVGVASEADVLLIETTECVDPANLLTRLAEQMPSGLTLREAWPVEGKPALQPEHVICTVPVAHEKIDHLAEAIHRIMAAETWPVERRGAGGKPDKRIDLRVYLVDASIENDRLRWTTRVTPEGSLRPAEMLLAVGLDPQTHLHRATRTAIEWCNETPP